jgi:hypothetical protein
MAITAPSTGVIFHCILRDEAPHRRSLELNCRLRKEGTNLLDWGKRLKEIRLGVDVMSNSTFLNEDVGIMGLVILNFGKQIIVSYLFWFAFCFTF